MASSASTSGFILAKGSLPGGEARKNAAIRKRLVHMLAVALDLKIETGQITELDWQREMNRPGFTGDDLVR